MEVISITMMLSCLACILCSGPAGPNRLRLRLCSTPCVPPRGGTSTPILLALLSWFPAFTSGRRWFFFFPPY